MMLSVCSLIWWPWREIRREGGEILWGMEERRLSMSSKIMIYDGKFEIKEEEEGCKGKISLETS